MEPTDLDLVDASRLLAGRELSAVELTRAYLARIEGLDARLNAFIVVTGDAALADAAAADARRARDASRGPLDGIPIALKDNLDVAGVATTAGMAARRGVIAERDAHVVRRLRDAGAVILGKLNLHEAALGGTTDNPHFGRTMNPHRLGYTPGGSSGGSAAAVAARLCAAALGTDTLGSVRLPAAYCGVAGIKPTAGLVSLTGVVPLAWRLDTVGPLARSVRDLGALLDVMAGFDPDSPESDAPSHPMRYGVDHADVRGTRVGRVRALEALVSDHDTRDAFERAVVTLVELGCDVQDVAIAGYDAERVRRAALLVIEAEGALVHAEHLAQHPHLLSDRVRAMLEYGRDARAERVMRAERVLTLARHAARRALETVDALALPTAPAPAFAFGTPPPDDQAVLTTLASVAGLPALSVPMGLTRDGLPLGLQLVGRPFAEPAILTVAHAYERAAKLDVRAEVSW